MKYVRYTISNRRVLFRLHAKSYLLGAQRHVSSINIPELRPMKVNGRNGGLWNKFYVFLTTFSIYNENPPSDWLILVMAITSSQNDRSAFFIERYKKAYVCRDSEIKISISTRESIV